jgi:NADH-quinone oxidoreductase subunit L
MSTSLLLVPILLPAAAGLLCLLCRGRLARAAGPLLVLAMVGQLVAVLVLLAQPAPVLDLPLGGFELALRFRLDALASFILLASAVLGSLIALYTARFMAGRPGATAFHAFFLFTMALAAGATLADHLLTLLFFWEGMLISLYVMIALGRPGAHATAAKAFFINGATDLCLLAGAGLAWMQAGTPVLSQIHLPAHGLSGLAFVLLAVGAASKAGAMPFHSWIPDAAVDAPAPFMAFLPGVIEKLLGIYALARISLDLFEIDGWAGTLLMVTGAATILLAVLMALVQRDAKRLLAFHAISQVGYMILGIGTGTTVGIVGGLFHMVNHAMYKGTLFLTAGAMERQAGTTDLEKLGGLARRMPVTFACFLVAACSISGVPPFNGFYSKELVYEGALERGVLYYGVAVLGSFFTAASFLKLGHAAFLGPRRAPNPEVREAPWAMLAPMVVIAAGCLLFGLGNALPVYGLVVPAVAAHLEPGHHLAGILPGTPVLAWMTVLVLAMAVAHHLEGARRAGSALGAVDHIHHAPGARRLYQAAERRVFDPYDNALRFLNMLARIGRAVDRGTDFLVDQLASTVAAALAALSRALHSGTHARYLAWVIAGTALVIFTLLGGF